MCLTFGTTKKIHYLCNRNSASNSKPHIAKADMAQLVEQRIRNAWVPGSSPGIGSNDNLAIIAQLVEH